MEPVIVSFSIDSALTDTQTLADTGQLLLVIIVMVVVRIILKFLWLYQQHPESRELVQVKIIICKPSTLKFRWGDKNWRIDLNNTTRQQEDKAFRSPWERFFRPTKKVRVDSLFVRTSSSKLSKSKCHLAEARDCFAPSSMSIVWGPGPDDIPNPRESLKAVISINLASYPALNSRMNRVWWSWFFRPCNFTSDSSLSLLDSLYFQISTFVNTS